MTKFPLFWLSLVLFACGVEDTPGRLVTGELTLATAGANTRSFALANGWTVELEEAVVAIGPVYLRPPKREQSLASHLFAWPTVHAHGQTLVDGDVAGEYLSQVAFDVLGAERSAGPFQSEATTLERVSLMLDVPRSPEVMGPTHGYHAFVRGRAQRGENEVVEFSCGLRIANEPNEQPKNVEARRRVDRVPLAATKAMDDGMRLRLAVHPDRWFDFISFDDFLGMNNPCAMDRSPFSLQWYLGIRRPEAFSAELF